MKEVFETLFPAYFLYLFIVFTPLIFATDISVFAKCVLSFLSGASLTAYLFGLWIKKH